MKKWRKGRILRNYTSELDDFLINFDKRLETTSVARQAEEARATALNALRDDPNAEMRTPIWETF